MALVDKTVQVPQSTSTLLDALVEAVSDVKSKNYGDLLDDGLQALKGYESFSDLKADFQQPEVAVAIGLALGQIGALFIKSATAAAKRKLESAPAQA